MVEFMIFQWVRDCYRCDEPTPVVWPFDADISSPASLDLVGPRLAEKPYANVERTYSQTQNQEVWGNLCIHCDAYQGNFFMRKAALDIPYQKSPTDSIRRALSCVECDREADRLSQIGPLCDGCYDNLPP